MRVLLVQPFALAPSAWLPYLPQEPLGLEYLSAYLRLYSPGTEVRILDCIGEYWQQYVKSENGCWVGASTSQMLEQSKSFDPDIVGVPMQFCTQEFELEHTVTCIKRTCKRSKIVVGGCAANADPAGLMGRIKDIDIIVMGEGEETLKEIVGGKFGKVYQQPLDQVRGIVYRDGDQVIANALRPYIADLDTIPFPDRRSVPFDTYSLSLMTSSLPDRLRIFKLWYQHNRDWATVRESLMSSRAKARPRVASMIATRGCPFNCYFCSTQNAWKRKYRHRSVSNVIGEMAHLYDCHKVRTYHFMDDNFNLNQDWVNEFCDRIHGTGWNIELRMQDGFFPRIERDTLRNLKKAGLKDVFFGIESGSQRVLDEVIKKPVTLKHVHEIIRWCHEIGINCGGYFLVGLPGEKLSEMQETVDFALYSGLDRVRLYTCQPFPGSQLYNDCVKNGWLFDGYDPSKAMLIGSEFYIRTPDFTPEQVKELVAAGRGKLREKKLLYQRKR